MPESAFAVPTYLAGGNTRRLRGALAPLLKGAPLSRSAVSRIVGTLYAELEAWRTRPLAEVAVVYLYLDALALRVRRAGKLVSTPVLGVVGVLADGQKQLLALELCGGESFEAWKGCVDDLVGRGVPAPILCVIDGQPGLRRAVELGWPTAAIQRCCVHKLRNLERKAPQHALVELRADFQDRVRSPDPYLGIPQNGPFRVIPTRAMLRHRSCAGSYVRSFSTRSGTPSAQKEERPMDQSGPPLVSHLKALTLEAGHALGGDSVPISTEPFRVGRETRQKTGVTLPVAPAERRAATVPSNNDVYLHEAAGTISREHFDIHRGPEGFYLTDRRSSAGTYVEGTLIGGNHEGGTAPLHDGDVIVVGPASSGLVYKFVLTLTSRLDNRSNDTLSSVVAEIRALREEIASLHGRLDERL